VPSSHPLEEAGDQVDPGHRFFQVLEVNGSPPATMSWKDTINVPQKGRVRIAWLPDDRPGSWMYHCHILEHHAAGRMAMFDVVQ
jgi:FtsP/CotA-like multicopper oxidase with cupredoxin domain